MIERSNGISFYSNFTETCNNNFIFFRRLRLKAITDGDGGNPVLRNWRMALRPRVEIWGLRQLLFYACFLFCFRHYYCFPFFFHPSMPAKPYILRSEFVNADSYVLFPTTDVRASRRSVTFRRVFYITGGVAVEPPSNIKVPVAQRIGSARWCHAAKGRCCCPWLYGCMFQ